MAVPVTGGSGSILTVAVMLTSEGSLRIKKSLICRDRSVSGLKWPVQALVRGLTWKEPSGILDDVDIAFGHDQQLRGDESRVCLPVRPKGRCLPSRREIGPMLLSLASKRMVYCSTLGARILPCDVASVDNTTAEVLGGGRRPTAKEF